MSWEKKKKKDARKWEGKPHFGCVSGFQFPYNLGACVREYRLPGGRGALSEVSGICFDRSTGLFMLIEDEHALLTAWREEEERVVWQEESLEGEFEDVAVMADGTVYMLKTNGNLVVRTTDKQWRQIKVPELSKADNCEGLCVWKEGALLMAPKAEDLEESEKRIYIAELHGGKMSTRLFFTISLEEIGRVLGTDIDQFNPSGIAVHPITGDIYVIATSGQLLVVLDPHEFRVRAVAHLPRDPFVQPEGITFRPDGTLYISNEGRTREGGPGVGTICRFAYAANK